MRISDWSSDVCSSDLRIAADADGRGLAQARIAGLEHRLIGQRAGARDDADAALGEDVARHDADLAFAGRQQAGAVGADQARLADRKSVVEGKRVSVRVDLGGRSIIKKKIQSTQ